MAFFDEDSFLEVPPLGTSGPSQAPSVYVADLGVCILEDALHAHPSPAPNPVFFSASRRDKRYGLKISLFSDSSFFCCLSDSSLLGSLKSPKPVWKGPKRTRFIHVKKVTHSFSPGPR